MPPSQSGRADGDEGAELTGGCRNVVAPSVLGGVALGVSRCGSCGVLLASGHRPLTTGHFLRRPCGDSNAGICLRRAALYPLSYRGVRIILSRATRRFKARKGSPASPRFGDSSRSLPFGSGALGMTYEETSPIEPIARTRGSRMSSLADQWQSGLFPGDHPAVEFVDVVV